MKKEDEIIEDENDLNNYISDIKVSTILPPSKKAEEKVEIKKEVSKESHPSVSPTQKVSKKVAPQKVTPKETKEKAPTTEIQKKSSFFSKIFKHHSSTPKERREFSFGEELANVITHGVSSFLVLCLLPIVSIFAWEKADASKKYMAVVGVAILCISLFLMFLSSTIYHAMGKNTKHKEVMHILDHIFIFVAIAGTYTPIALYTIGGVLGWVLFGIQWAATIAGILVKSIRYKSTNSRLSTMIYLIMGWSIIGFLPFFLMQSPLIQTWLVFAGGILYSVGAFFYSKREWRYSHMVWHILIFLGAVCQVIGACFFSFL